MEFEVIRAKSEGKLVPKWQLGAQKRLRGHLHIEDRHLTHLNRHSRCATLLTEVMGASSIGELWDAQVVHATRGYWMISGIESIEGLANGATTLRRGSQRLSINYDGLIPVESKHI